MSATSGGNPLQSKDWPVRIHTLGQFQVEVHGARLNRTGRQRKKPIELLKAVIAMGGECSLDELTEQMWEESDGDRAYNSFFTTKARVKEVLGLHVMAVQDGRVILDRDLCWVDALALPDEWTAVSQGLQRGDLESASEAMERVLDLYRKPFLEGEFKPVAILSARERLHSKWIGHLLDLAKHFKAAGQLERAAELYRKGLEIDDTSQEIYRGLLEAYRDLGRIADGVALYQRCARTFEMLVGIAPPPEIEAVYRQLQAKQREQAPPGASADVATSAEKSGAAQTSTVAPAPTPRSRPAAALPIADEGERRRVVTVCHVLGGYGDLFAQLDAEAARAHLHTVYSALEQVAAEYSGVVNLANRDEVVVLYGIPAAHEDDPQQALRAALEAHRRIRELPPPDGVGAALTLRLSTGVEAGPVLLQPGGAAEGRLGATGEAVNQAVKLARQAAQDEVLVGASTQPLVRPYFTTEPATRGKRGADGPHRVLAWRGTLSRMEIGELQGLTPLTGREAELRALGEALREARAGRGKLVTIVGDAGVGKSRLVHEFCGQVVESIALMRADCQPHAAHTPYAPFQELLRQAVALRQADPPEDQARRAVRRLLAMDPSLKPHIPYCLRLLSLPGGDEALPPNLGAEELRSGIVTAVGAVLMAGLQHQPLMLVLEDLHWADEASIVALRNLSAMLGEFPVLFIVTYRSEYDVRWLRNSHHLHMELESLPARDVQAMLGSLLGTERIDKTLEDAIHKDTEGNPFYVEEVCRALVEDGTVQVVDGEARLAVTAPELKIPKTVELVVRARVDRLPPETLKILRIASVFGPIFSQRVLAFIAPEGTHPMTELDTLVAAQLIRQVEVVPEVRYRFSHNITQRVVYDSLLAAQRKMLHQRAGEAVEHLYADRIEEHLESLALHFHRGTSAGKALTYLERAAEKAAQVYSLHDARNHYHAALALLEELPQNPEHTLRKVDTITRLGMVSFYRPSQALLTQLESARADAEQLRDQRRTANAAFIKAVITYGLAYHRDALKAFDDFLRLPALDEDMRALAQNYQGRIQFYLTDIPEAERTLVDGIQRLERLGNHVEAANSRTIMACLNAFCGRVDAGREQADRAARLSAELGNPSLMAASQVVMALVVGYGGEWQAAREAGLRARETAHSVNNTISEGMGTWCEGFADAMLGNVEQGIAGMREGIGIVESTESRLALGGFTSELARVCAAEGRLEEAQIYVRKARALANSGADRLSDLILPFAEAALAAKRKPGQLKVVRQILDRGLRACEQRGARLWLAVNHYYYALLMARLRQTSTALDQLELAQALFTEMGMAWWKRKGTALRKQLRRS